MENQFIRGWEVANTYKHYLLRVIQVNDYGRPDGRDARLRYIFFLEGASWP
jgi:hypothetical protein